MLLKMNKNRKNFLRFYSSKFIDTYLHRLETVIAAKGTLQTLSRFRLMHSIIF